MNDLRPEWRTTSNPPIEMSRFGRDHWSTFGYIEGRIVDHKGALSHAHMRCHAMRHPAMMLAKGSGLGVADASAYATYLRDNEELPDHDDYDCIDDLIAAGLLEVHMPELSRGHHVDSYYVNAYGRPITDPDGALIGPDFVTGLTELYLCAHATFSLTARGKQVASDLRAHKGAGNQYATFAPE